jgi:hypothetical protein
MDAYTIPEAARAAGLSPREVRMRIEEGDLRAFIRAGRRMVEATELERLVDRPMPPTPALRAAPPPQASPRVVENLVARLEEQALELVHLKTELTRAHERIAELESVARRPGLTELFQRTE